MKNYNGQEMVIRTTNNGKFQVLPERYTPQDMSRAPVFPIQSEAEAYIVQPMPQWVADENAKNSERVKYNIAYSEILARTELREMRREIQNLYEHYMWESKLAGDAQRAVAYGIGKISCMGRNVADVRQGNADYQSDQATLARQAWEDSSRSYELAVQQAMVEMGIPVELFRSPVLGTTGTK